MIENDTGSNENKKFVVAYKAFGIMEAEMVRGILESADIPVFIEKMEQVYPSTMDGFAAIPIVVPEEKAQEAKDLLAQALSGQDGLSEDQDLS